MHGEEEGEEGDEEEEVEIVENDAEPEGLHTHEKSYCIKIGIVNRPIVLVCIGCVFPHRIIWSHNQGCKWNRPSNAYGIKFYAVCS